MDMKKLLDKLTVLATFPMTEKLNESKTVIETKRKASKVLTPKDLAVLDQATKKVARALYREVRRDPEGLKLMTNMAKNIVNNAMSANGDWIIDVIEKNSKLIYNILMGQKGDEEYEWNEEKPGIIAALNTSFLKAWQAVSNPNPGVMEGRKKKDDKKDGKKKDEKKSSSGKSEWAVKGTVDGKTKVITVRAGTESEARDSATNNPKFKVVSVRKKGGAVDAEELDEAKVNEKWGVEMKTAKKDKGKWKGWTKAELKARKKKLMDKEERSAAEQTEVRQINFALRAKGDWGKIKESQEVVAEKSAPGQESWIKKNKKRFIDQYGKEKGLRILYATAWKRSKGE